MVSTSSPLAIESDVLYYFIVLVEVRESEFYARGDRVFLLFFEWIMHVFFRQTPHPQR